MSTYKVIQDIEAEDKLIGPLTLRQFIYAVIAIVCGFLAFRLGAVNFLLMFPFLPFILFFGALAAPLGRDQPTEVWLLAKIRFFLKPRRRIWDQSGIKDLVTITAPKKIERMLTNDLSQTEVRSRLEALANTIDSRGWAIKNVNVNLYSQPSYLGAGDNSDRLVVASSLPQDIASIDVQPSDDILDEQTNPTAQHFDQMVAAVSQAHKQQAITQMQQAVSGNNQQPAPDYWFMRGTPAAAASVPSGFSTFQKSQVVAPGANDRTPPSATPPSATEQELLNKIHASRNKPNPAYRHMRTITPLSDQKAQKPNPMTNPPMPAAPDPGIIQLANNDDLNVATIARQADKAKKQQPPADEVVISLR